jgi:hypothetical protein
MTSKELKSKAMTLGNKLAPRMGGDRKAAFVEAWAIVKKGGLTLPVKGVAFGSRPEALRRLAAYSPSAIRAFLVAENNRHDRNAIAVMAGVQNGTGLYKLEYIPAGDTAKAGPFLGRLPRLSITGGGDCYRARVTLAVTAYSSFRCS